jgi:hypothetical protein
MLTIIGKIENAAGTTLHARIDFVSRSTPLVGAGVITTNSDVSIRSNPSDGTFSVQLAPGDYQVTITAENQVTAFSIAVPDGSTTVSIETLVTTPLLYTYLAPNAVWNGIRPGQITFVPIGPPNVPATNPVNYGGGHQDHTSSFNYRIAWQAADGTTTQASGDAPNSAPGGANNATEVGWDQPPSGVTATLIYRSNDGAGRRYLLASVAPNVLQYVDWESAADFGGRLNPAQLAPVFNTTSGGLLSSANQAAAYFSDQGIYFPGTNARIVSGKGLQIFNSDTNLWHTLLCVGNPAQLGLDAGQI